MDQLNARFMAGRPSNILADAGVLVRQFDGLENYARPWEPCEQGRFCHTYSDRFASSLINSKQRLLYSRTSGGLIVNTDVAHILCSYYSDGGSQSRQCTPPGVSDECTPGCSHECKSLQDFRGCSWPPSAFKEMMEQQMKLHAGGGHNEVCGTASRAQLDLTNVMRVALLCSELEWHIADLTTYLLRRLLLMHITGRCHCLTLSLLW